MSSIVFETHPNAAPRYRVEVMTLGDWKLETASDSLWDATRYADVWSKESGYPYRVVDTQAEPAMDEAVREPDNKIGTLYVDIVPALNATCKENAGEFTDPAEPVNKTGRFDEGDLLHALDIAFAGFRCACDACAEFEAARTARERGSEPTSKPCKSDMDTYQTASGETAIYPNTTVEQGLDYLIPTLTAEAGEVAGKWAKWKRDSNNLGMTRELRDEIVTECGDVLWTLARITEDLGFSLSDVADLNIRKLQDRQQRGTLKGSGDDR